MKLSEYVEYDATGLAALIRDGEVPAAEVHDAARAALEAVDETLNAVADRHQARLDFPDGLRLGLEVSEASAPRLFPFVQLYTMPDQPFFCIEPWMAAPNTLNAVSGARLLGPGAADRAVLRLTMGERT